MYNVWDILFPIKCVNCKKVGSAICITCRNYLQPCFNTNCLVCNEDYFDKCPGNCFSPFSNVLRITLYPNCGVVKKCLEYKNAFVYLETLSTYSAEDITDAGFIIPKGYALTYLPTPTEIQTSLGFDCNKVMATAFARKLELKPCTVLNKHKTTDGLVVLTSINHTNGVIRDALTRVCENGVKNIIYIALTDEYVEKAQKYP